MAVNFPTELQQKFNEAGFSNQFGDTAITSNVAVGLPKKRRRYTQAVDIYNSTIDLEIDDYNTLKNFHDTTLAGGTLTFNFDNPLTGTTDEFQFVNPPQITPLGGRYFRVRNSWRLIP